MNQLLALSQAFTMSDNGPIYRETGDLSQTIVEPWNAYSSLTFVVCALVLLWQLRGKMQQFPFIVFFCVPLLILGGFGSTFFHAFRSSVWLLLLDILPIVILVLGVSSWMWIKVLHKKWLIIPILVVFFGFTYIARQLLNGQDQISAGYVVRGIMLLLPCYLYLRKTDFQYGSLLLFTSLFLILALTFRYLDEKIVVPFMPWGTHWLWHVSTAFAGYFLGRYLIRTTERSRS